MPSGESRASVSATLSFDVGFDHTATLRLWGPDHRQIAKITTVVRDSEPQSLSKEKSPDGLFQYPIYEVLTAAGITEVAEHKQRGPVFFMTDDPAVRKALGVP